MTTTFVMDLNSGLTQALSDGTNDYIYGLGRIAQVNGTNTEYFLGDALGSVRQLTDSTGAVTFAQGYAPYGTVTTTSGSGASSYGFTNEYQSQGKIYLRARFYAPAIGRFLTRDTWGGDANRPMTFNRWGYVEGNPINKTDPTGNYSINPNTKEMFIQNIAIGFGISYDGGWTKDNKATISQAVLDVGIKFSTVIALSPALSFRYVFPRGITFVRNPKCPGCRPASCIKEGKFEGNASDGEPCTPIYGWTKDENEIQFATFYDDNYMKARNNVVHEIGHAFDNRLNFLPRKAMNAAWIKTAGLECAFREKFPSRYNEDAGPYYGFASPAGVYLWQMNPSPGGGEEFADSFLGWVYDTWETKRDGTTLTGNGTARSEWMNEWMGYWLNTIKASVRG